ncbi:MAG: hypothetical protein ABIO53_06055 [Chitinophagaceae bacterium]
MLKQVILETAPDAQHFTALAALSASTRSYSYHVLGGEAVYYRLRAITATNNTGYTSNIISLKSRVPIAAVQVINNNGAISFKSSGNFSYQLWTVTGQLIGKGRLLPGMNQLPVRGAKGVLVLNYSNGSQSFTQKIMQQ